MAFLAHFDYLALFVVVIVGGNFPKYQMLAVIFQNVKRAQILFCRHLLHLFQNKYPWNRMCSAQYPSNWLQSHCAAGVSKICWRIQLKIPLNVFARSVFGFNDSGNARHSLRQFPLKYTRNIPCEFLFRLIFVTVWWCNPIIFTGSMCSCHEYSHRFLATDCWFHILHFSPLIIGLEP